MGAEATAESGGGGGGGGDPFTPSLVPASVMFDGTADKLDKTFSSGSAQSKIVWSSWVQRCAITPDQVIFFAINAPVGNAIDRIFFTTDNKITVSVQNTSFASTIETSTRTFQDTAWYHILLSIDGSATEGIQLFVNGDAVSLTRTLGVNFTGTMFAWGNAMPHKIGYQNTGSGAADSFFYNGYMAQCTFLTGQSIQSGDVAVSDFLGTHTFGTNGSQVIPKDDSAVALLASNAGGNSFSLDFSNSGSLGNDASSNNNDFTPSSMTSANASNNTPSKMYATMNPLIPSNSTLTFAEGNRRVTGTAGSDGGTFSTLPLPTTGTTEFQMTTNNGDGGVGIACYDNALAVAGPANNVRFGSAIAYDASYTYAQNGSLTTVVASGQTAAAFGGAWTTNDVITVRYNADANELNFLKNNVAQGTTVSTVAGLTYYAAVSRFGNYDCTLHFDEAEFPHTIGVGNKTINTADLATPSFQGKDFFDATLYTGNSATQTVGGGSDSKFTAFAWIKDRDATSSNMLFDRVRGEGTDLRSNTSGAQVFNTDTFDTFLQRGGELGADSQVNLNNNNFVLWQWLAGSSATTGSSNGTGSIASTVIASAAQNFSVGTFTGTGANATIGHSLGGAPEAIIMKNATTGSVDWAVYHKDIRAIAGGSAEDFFLELNTTQVATDDNTLWNDTAPTSTVFSVGTSSQTNQSTKTMSFLAFRSIPGVCKVGSYRGNGATNGPLVLLDFKPRWIMIKNTVSTENWCIIDTARTPFNSATDPLVLSPNVTTIGTSGTLSDVDFLANGLKFRGASSPGNASGSNFIYIAMADIGGRGTLPPIYGV